MHLSLNISIILRILFIMRHAFIVAKLINVSDFDEQCPGESDAKVYKAFKPYLKNDYPSHAYYEIEGFNSFFLFDRRIIFGESNKPRIEVYFWGKCTKSHDMWTIGRDTLITEKQLGIF